MAINKNDELHKLHSFSDRLADRIAAIAGSVAFLVCNAGIFTFWLFINSGHLGPELIFDRYPFGLLTTLVSLEAIVLSVFVLISQNRQSKLIRLRSELDYRADLQAEADVETMVAMLELLAKKQKVDVSELVADLKTKRRRVLLDNPISKD